MIVICLNGSINSGKTTIGRALAAALPDAAFIDGDDHDAHDADFADMLEIAFSRLEREIATAQVAHLIIAYPLRDEDFVRLAAAAAARNSRFFVATLAPPLGIVLADRGARRLSDDVRARVREMYDEGYAERAFSHIVIGDTPPPAAIVEALRAAIRVG